jgi:multiple sugar transport system ATP-binding protein
MGSEIYLYLKANDQKLVARVPAYTNVKAEDDIRVAFDTEKIHVFDKETEKVICQ